MVKGITDISNDAAVSVIVHDYTSSVNPEAKVNLSLADANSLNPTLNLSSLPILRSGVAIPVFARFRAKEQIPTGAKPSWGSWRNPVVGA